MTTRGTRFAVTAVGLAVLIFVAGVGLLFRWSAETADDVPAGTVALLTEAPPGMLVGPPTCDSPTTGSLLVPHPVWGLALRGAGPPLMTVWPRDYVARIVGERIELLDADGRLLARTGDRIGVTGDALGTGDVFVVCPGSLYVMPAT